MAPSRRPTVLVTDARNRHSQQRQAVSSGLPSMVRFISVDNVLQSSPSIPSAQTRANPLGHLHRARTPSSPLLPPQRSQNPVNPRRQVNQSQTLPIRSSKVSEKLVLLPETDADDDTGRWDYLVEDDEGPLRDGEEEPVDEDEEDVPPTTGHPPRKSYAERLPKARRADKFSRVTAYCTADAFRLAATSNFLRNVHGARAKLYDECLYVAYHLPLMPGGSGHRVHSSPALKSPGGKAVLDVEIERSEQRNYHEGYFENSYNHQRRASGDSIGSEDGVLGLGKPQDDNLLPQSPPAEQETAELDDEHQLGSPKDNAYMDMKGFAEMFVFSYGVVVFWNFTEKQEKDILADLSFAATDMGLTLISGPLKEEDFESEEFHFEYSTRTRSPRIYNDMITLRSGDIMVKLAIAHAIAQSTKLCRFEERMNTTMAGVEHIPRKLALTGTLGMKREEVIKMSGRLFRLRVDVNLSSNVLDVPEFFWDSEPTLHPLYAAVREYLEIKQRILVLNERCRVFLDLADILSDSIADSNMSRITWIIIILIILSILVTVAEVTIRFGILTKAGKKQAIGEAIRIGAGLLGVNGKGIEP